MQCYSFRERKERKSQRKELDPPLTKKEILGRTSKKQILGRTSKKANYGKNFSPDNFMRKNKRHSLLCCCVNSIRSAEL